MSWHPSTWILPPAADDDDSAEQRPIWRDRDWQEEAADDCEYLLELVLGEHIELVVEATRHARFVFGYVDSVTEAYRQITFFP